MDEHTENPDTLDPAKVIAITSRRSKGIRPPNKGGHSKPDKYKAILEETLREEQERRLAALTPAELEFVDLIVGGTSMAHALKLTHPELCWKRSPNGEPITRRRKNEDGEEVYEPVELSGEQIWDRADKFRRRPTVRAQLRQLLEQEMDDVKHTSLEIHNFVQKRYMIEALEARTPAARITALDRLAAYGAVVAREREQTRKLTTPEEVYSAIDAELKKLGR